MRYEKPKAGEWVRPVMKGYKMACCDCSLVHRMNFKIVNGKAVEFQVFLDKRATAAMRRKKKA